MTRALFICGMARKRSPTAADIAGNWNDVENDFSGLSNDADEKLSLEQIEWADLIFVMEKKQKMKLMRLFSDALRGTRIICLDIPDKYEYMSPELVDRLTPGLRLHLRR